MNYKIIPFVLYLFLTSLICKAQWSELNGINPPNFNEAVYSVITDLKGNLYAAGSFTNTNGNQYIAKWNGSSWGELGGTNTSSFNNTILSLTLDTLGNVFAGGAFTNTNGKNYVAKWNGSNWSELGGTNISTFNSTIWSITSDIAGNIYAAGNFKNSNNIYTYVAKWNGSNWSELGGVNASTFNGTINSITLDLFGNIYAGGIFKNSKGNTYVAKWNGNSWSELGGTNTSKFNSNIKNIISDDSSKVYISGVFTNGTTSQTGNEYIALWNGSNWSELGGANSSNFKGEITWIIKDKIGNILCGGGFTNSKGYNYVAKWNGNNWSELGGTNSSPFNGINCITLDNLNNIFLGGGIYSKPGGFGYVFKFINFDTVIGRIITPLYKPIKNVNLSSNGTTTVNSLSDTDGIFRFNLNNGNYNITPSKNNDINKANGVTALDLSLIQAHILGKNLLNNPYKLIAADVTGDGKITALDLVYMQRLILGKDTTFTNKTTNQIGLWRFVDSSYKFPDSTNPFSFKGSISYTGLYANKTNQTFIGVKLGDVNWDWNPLLARKPRQQIGIKIEPLKINQ